MSEGPADFSDSFYYRVRTRIGEVLRTLFVPAEPAPERFSKLLLALDQPKEGSTGGTEDKQEGGPPDEQSVRQRK
jgi:hypothetical protein